MNNKLNNIIDNINKKGKTTREYMSIHEEGVYVIRLLQDVNDEEAAPFEEFYLHGGFIHPLYKKSSNVRCLRTKDCPMCVAAKKIKDKTPGIAWKYEAKQFYVYNVIDRKDGKLKLLKVSWAAHNKIIAKVLEMARQGSNVMHFKTGHDIELVARKIDSKIDYKGYVVPESENKPVAGKIIEELKLLKPLSEAYRPYSKQELQDIVDGKIPSNNYNTDKPKVSKSSLIDNLNKKMNQNGNNSSNNKNLVKTDSLKQLEAEINSETDTVIDKKNSESDIASRLSNLNIFESDDEGNK